MEIDFSSPRREMLLFLTTIMAAVSSRANQLFFYLPLWNLKPNLDPGMTVQYNAH